MQSILNNSKNLNQTRPHPPITDRSLAIALYVTIIKPI
jgi:hypothetical protein